MIHHITLGDCLEPTAPPGRVLVICALDDTVFVRISKLDQDHQSEKLTDEAPDISVSLPSLIEALHLLANDQERENLRPVESDGKTRESKLAGGRLNVLPVPPGSAVGAVTRHLRNMAADHARKDNPR